jgi:hypothetical protein
MGYYFVQGMYSDGRICFEDSVDSEEQATHDALELVGQPWFEGDKVRVLTGDGECIYTTERMR